MPIYEYECPVCGRFEVLQKVGEASLRTCPNCKEKGKKSTIKKAISTAAFHLKGSGWYKTDYSSSAGGGDKTSKKSSATNVAESNSSDKTAETKPSGESPTPAAGDKKKACGPSCACH